MDHDALLGRHQSWDVFYSVVAVAVAAITVATSTAPVEKFRALGLLAAIALWYVFVGRPIIVCRTHGPVRQGVFVAGLVALYFGLATATSAANLLLLALCSMVLFMENFLFGALAVVALNTATVGAAVAAGQDVVDAIVLSAAISVWSVVLGRWSRRVIEQSIARAEMIAELEASREEVARLSHEAGTAAERQRVAADIHDTLAQGFGSIVMLVQAVRRSIELESPTVDEQLDLIERTARDNLAEARAIVTAMQPAALAAVTVEEAIRRLADDADVAVTGASRELPPAVAVVLLRSCQEALTNIRRHAGTAAVRIGLSYSDDTVALTVHDDGRGFDPAAVAGGFGLSGMRGRATEVGGTMTLDSAPGAGTTVRVEVPA
ncbi:sensor histidine kinase [Phytomonospora endophytica]|uniref:Oxygen sensor histidine kinase NreB n=1 Tax=Phytomonospora endophytica TaxID=714109 RepID=A0A841FP57_9ACTN|nr:sensor histidine kinase [Phytomonospora endophytica]MBB6037614.1 signal transduction histidine kinase [Phytomonospora endophytica]GIG67861.1 two-component sensor histidine kinase [Phytomonospora endophytica]